MDNSDLCLGFKTFILLFERTLSKCALRKQRTKKDKKFEIKPWITKGIKKSLMKRDNLYREMVKSKNSQVKI